MTAQQSSNEKLQGHYNSDLSCESEILVIELTQHCNSAHDPMGLRLIRKNAHVHDKVGRVARCGECSTPFTCLINGTEVVRCVLNLVFFARYQPHLLILTRFKEQG